jgi:uncharacterized protein
MNKIFTLALATFISVVFASAQNAPVANFSCDTVNTNPCCIAFNDLSTNSPTSWSWSSPGGTPATSISQNPVICYLSSGTYTVVLTVTNSFGSDTSVGTITVSPLVCSCSSTVGIDKISANENSIIVLPNPAISQIEIRNSKFEIRTIEIYDMHGQRVFSRQPAADSQQQVVINISSLSKGIYFVRIADTRGNKAAGKFVKM